MTWADRRRGWSRDLDTGLELPWDQATVQKHTDGWWVRAGLVKVQNRLNAPEWDVAVSWKVAPPATDHPAALDLALDDLTRLVGGSMHARVRQHGDGYLVVQTGSLAAELNGVTE